MANHWRMTIEGAGPYCERLDGAPACTASDCVYCHARGLAAKLAARGHAVSAGRFERWFDGAGSVHRVDDLLTGEPAAAPDPGYQVGGFVSEGPAPLPDPHVYRDREIAEGIALEDAERAAEARHRADQARGTTGWPLEREDD